MADWQVGDIEVTSVLEQVAEFMTLEEFFDGFTPEMFEANKDWLIPDAVSPTSGKMILPIQSYLVRTRHHTILIDTCVDCHKKFKWVPEWNDRRDDAYLKNLVAAGVDPADIDYVFCTHLHVDHCGWNTRMEDGRFVPTFPNAKYIFAKDEYDSHAENNSIVFRESVLPVMEAKQAELVAMDFALDDNLSLSPTPGHTVGHVAVEMTSNGQLAAMSGDLMHSPLQCIYTSLRPTVDLDQKQAGETRRRFLEEHADRDKLVMTAHFPLPSVGRVVSAGDAFRFEYLER